MIKNTKSYSNIFQRGFATTIRGSIRVVSYFSHTPLYPLYVLFNIVGGFCNQKSIYALLWLIVVLLTLFHSLFLSVVLNLSITREKIERLIGVSFLEKDLGGPQKGLVSFLLFLFTLVVLDCVFSISLLSRVHEHRESLQLINQEMEKISTDRPVAEALSSVYKVVSMSRSMPYKSYPTTGILTDIASYFCFF